MTQMIGEVRPTATNTEDLTEVVQDVRGQLFPEQVSPQMPEIGTDIVLSPVDICTRKFNQVAQLVEEAKGLADVRIDVASGRGRELAAAHEVNIASNSTEQNQAEQAAAARDAELTDEASAQQVALQEEKRRLAADATEQVKRIHEQAEAEIAAIRARAKRDTEAVEEAARRASAEKDTKITELDKTLAANRQTVQTDLERRLGELAQKATVLQTEFGSETGRIEQDKIRYESYKDALSGLLRGLEAVGRDVLYAQTVVKQAHAEANRLGGIVDEREQQIAATDEARLSQQERHAVACRTYNRQKEYLDDLLITMEQAGTLQQYTDSPDYAQQKEQQARLEGEFLTQGTRMVQANEAVRKAQLALEQAKTTQTKYEPTVRSAEADLARELERFNSLYDQIRQMAANLDEMANGTQSFEEPEDDKSAEVQEDVPLGRQTSETDAAHSAAQTRRWDVPQVPLMGGAPTGSTERRLIVHGVTVTFSKSGGQ